MWELIGLIEKYGADIFIKVNIGMEKTYNINTTAIKDVLEIEGYTGKECSEMFNDLCIFIQSGINRRMEDDKKYKHKLAPKGVKGVKNGK